MPDFERVLRRFAIADVDERFTGEDGESEANALLIADAFNTFTATGLTPSELAEQRGELIGALSEMIELRELTMQSRVGEKNELDIVRDAKAALTKATETPQ